VPDAKLPPADEAVIAGGGRSIALGNVCPGRTGAKAPVDAVQDLAVIGARHPSRLIRQQRCDDGPLEIGQFVTACAHRSSSQELESLFAPKRKMIYEFVT